MQAREVARRISGAVAREIYAKVIYKVPITNPYPSHYIICLSFSSPPLHPCHFICPSFAVCLSFACVLFACVLDCLLVTMDQNNTKLCEFSNTNNNDFISTPIAPITDAESCEINVALLNLVMKHQLSGLPSEDAATHLNNFVDLCDMQKKSDTDNDIVKLKLFPFSLRDRAKTWFSSLPRNSIDSWNKCKDAFISKYLPPAKIISLRNDIMNFKQLDHEHVAQAWERMKLMIRNCPTHGLNLWMIIQNFYAGLNFASRNLLDSAAGGTFMETTLGEATKLLDNIMVNYSQWHTERSTSKKGACYCRD